MGKCSRRSRILGLKLGVKARLICQILETFHFECFLIMEKFTESLQLGVITKLDYIARCHTHY